MTPAGRSVRRALRAVGAGVALCAASAAAALAQDFAPTEPAGPSGSALGLLDRGLPVGAPPTFEASFTSWLGIPGLSTHAASAAMGFGSVRVAAGVSRTGPRELGWDAAGVAAGMATAAGGGALRVIGRREATGEEPEESPASGLEAGGGAWVRAGRSVRVWARAPQAWTGGQSPPLPRPLALGLSLDAGGVVAWLEREGPARASDADGTHAAGVMIDLGLAKAWVEAKERPIRAGFGCSLSGGRIAVRLRVESHPLLGETITIAISARARTDARTRPPARAPVRPHARA